MSELVADVDLARDHVLGNPDADVTLVEYGSYACEYCHAAHRVMGNLREKFGERLRYVYRHLPLTDRELALYERLVGWLELDVVRPDVVVYLQASTEMLMERIAKRGRPFEKDMDRDYIKRLNEAYNHFFFHWSEAPLLVVSTDAIDFVNHPDDFEDLLKRIVSHRAGTTYYAPIERGTPS